MIPRDPRRFAFKALLALALACAGFGPPIPGGPSNEYVGAERCRPCHIHAFETWVHSAHARSGLVFGMRAGAYMMQDAEARLRETGEEFPCATCHRPPGRPTVHTAGPDFHPENGVQCEVCHGPGGTHVAAETVGDTLTGHRIIRPEPVTRLCDRCHYDEKPFHVRAELGTPAFEFQTWWQRIAHPTPPEEKERR